MSIDIHTPIAIDPSNHDYQPLFAELQGGIIKSHGRNHVICLLVRFQENACRVRAWLREFCTLCLTSTAHQLAESRRYRLYGVPGSLFVNVYLSSSGYSKLGIAEEQRPADRNFREGMGAAWQVTEEERQRWDTAYRGGCDAILLLADDDERTLRTIARQVRTSLRDVATSVAVETGHTLRDASGQPIEHFGYADGVSQPVFLQPDLERAKARQGGTDQWNPLAPLSIALAPDPLGGSEMAYGSYLVFRKLEQNVRQFYESATLLAQRLNPDAPNRDLAAASVMGRFRDGTPVALFDEAYKAHPDRYNNFRYGDDEGGLRCPYQAHARKVNPRRSEDGADRRIIRRGIPYGQRTVAAQGNFDSDLRDLPSRGSGLLFMCFQSDIGEQFEHLQRQMEDPDLPCPGTGKDALAAVSDDTEQWWNPQWGRNGSRERGELVPFAFNNVVHLLGGEYFFAPSVSFFQAL